MSELQQPEENVALLVGGIPYILRLSELTKHRESFFANLVNPNWKKANTDPIVIERDGTLFHYICDFLRYGYLPRNKLGELKIGKDILLKIRNEADFFQLCELVAECDAEEAPHSGAVAQLLVYKAVQEAFETIKYRVESNWHVPELVADVTETKVTNRNEVEDEDEEENKKDITEKQEARFRDLLREVSGPFCITGKLDVGGICRYGLKCVHKSSTLQTLNIDELLAEATLSPFGRGAETVIDTNVRHSYEIDISKSKTFLASDHIDIKHLAPQDRYVDIRPYKLVIYKEGGQFHEHRDTVRGENHIGTLVIILNSEYTGGELVVSHGGRTETVTGAYSWVAMYGDCLHKINPVTSGTRVSLIYDLYHKKPDLYGYPAWCVNVHDVWSASYGSIPLNSIPRGATEAQRAAVIAGMHQQLAGYEAAVISLKHLYPACQANPDFLKGGDQLLYEILIKDFALSVIPATIYRRKMDSYSERGDENACCIKPFVNDLLPKEDIELAVAAAQLKTKVIMVESLTRDHLIENEQIDYTGNEGEGQETVYLVAMLQVRRKDVGAF